MGSVNGLFRDLNVRLVEGRTGSGRVDGGLARAERLLVNGGVAGSVDGGLVDVDALSEGRAGGRGVNGDADLYFVTVIGLEARTVLAFGNVDDRVVGAVGVVDLDTRLGVGREGSAVLFAKVLLTDAGTAVSFLFTSNADLFFTEATLAAGKFGLGLE